MAVLERRLASLTALALHDRELFADELAALAGMTYRTPEGQGQVSPVRFCQWWLASALGTFLTRQRGFDALALLFGPVSVMPYGQVVPLLDINPSDAGTAIADAVSGHRGVRSRDAPSALLVSDLAGLSLFSERYPELVEGDDEPTRSFVEFDLILSLAQAVRGERALARWSMYSHAQDFAYLLRGDSGFRDGVARAVGLTAEQFDAQATTMLRNAYALGDYIDAADILSPEP